MIKEKKIQGQLYICYPVGENVADWQQKDLPPRKFSLNQESCFCDDAGHLSPEQVDAGG